MVRSRFGGSVVHDSDKPEELKAEFDFPKQQGLLKDHWWHIHKMIVTYRGRVRATKNSWGTIIDKSGCRRDQQTFAAIKVITGGATR